MVICLQRGADLHTAQLIPLPLSVSCFSKIQIGFTFLLLAYLGSPGKGPLNVGVCVRVCVCVWLLGCGVCELTDGQGGCTEPSHSWPACCQVLLLLLAFLRSHRPARQSSQVMAIGCFLVFCIPDLNSLVSVYFSYWSAGFFQILWMDFAFCALTLLVERQEEHRACWCGYLSGARCRLFAYGPADATASPKPHNLLPQLNPDWFYLYGTSLPRFRLSWKRGR